MQPEQKHRKDQGNREEWQQQSVNTEPACIGGGGGVQHRRKYRLKMSRMREEENHCGQNLSPCLPLLSVKAGAEITDSIILKTKAITIIHNQARVSIRNHLSSQNIIQSVWLMDRELTLSRPNVCMNVWTKTPFGGWFYSFNVNKNEWWFWRQILNFEWFQRETNKIMISHHSFLTLHFYKNEFN